MTLNVCIAGATGWIGEPLCLAVSRSVDLNLVGAVSRTHKGRNLKDVQPDLNIDLKISGSLAEALTTPTDVLVDYTKETKAITDYEIEHETSAHATGVLRGDHTL